MPKLYLDAGNADIKWFNGNQSGYFRHAVAQLTNNDWKKIVGRSKSTPEGYIQVNGIPYAVGETARRYQIKQRPKGAARYVETYYGVLLAQALAYAFDRSSASVTLYATHAPQDIEYAIDLEMSAKQRWHVVSHRGEMTFQIRRVETIDEPLGGYNYFILTKDGRAKKNNDIAQKTVLMIDAGGHTVDKGVVDPGGIVDLQSLGSTEAGTIEMLHFFEKELRGNNRAKFKTAGVLDPRRVEQALLTGSYPYGNSPIACVAESRAAFNMLTNDIVDIIRTAGGAANYDLALLTGGGGVLLVDALKEAVPDLPFVLVDNERENMRFANVWGAQRLFTLLEKMKAI